jgi:hypothetical protein
LCASLIRRGRGLGKRLDEKRRSVGCFGLGLMQLGGKEDDDERSRMGGVSSLVSILERDEEEEKGKACIPFASSPLRFNLFFPSLHSFSVQLITLQQILPSFLLYNLTS